MSNHLTYFTKFINEQEEFKNKGNSIYESLKIENFIKKISEINKYLNDVRNYLDKNGYKVKELDKFLEYLDVKMTNDIQECYYKSYFIPSDKRKMQLSSCIEEFIKKYEIQNVKKMLEEYWCARCTEFAFD